MSNISLTQANTNQETQAIPIKTWQDFKLPDQADAGERPLLFLYLQDNTSAFQGSVSSRELLIHDNLQDHEPEPEDVILVTSGILPKLIAQARQEPPSDDWERILDEL